MSRTFLQQQITPSPRVLAGTNGNVDGLKALAISLERSKQLVENTKKLVQASKIILAKTNKNSK